MSPNILTTGTVVRNAQQRCKMNAAENRFGLIFYERFSPSRLLGETIDQVPAGLGGARGLDQGDKQGFR